MVWVLIISLTYAAYKAVDIGMFHEEEEQPYGGSCGIIIQPEDIEYEITCMFS